jgi:hypothetical protein
VLLALLWFLALRVHQLWERCPLVELFSISIRSLVMVRLLFLRPGLRSFSLWVAVAVAVGLSVVVVGPAVICLLLQHIYRLERQRLLWVLVVLLALRLLSMKGGTEIMVGLHALVLTMLSAVAVGLEGL